MLKRPSRIRCEFVHTFRRDPCCFKASELKAVMANRNYNSFDGGNAQQ